VPKERNASSFRNAIASPPDDFAEDTALHWPEEAKWEGAGWDDYARHGTPADAPRANAGAAHKRLRAPAYSLWLGAGLGWTLPFGNLLGRCTQADAYGQCILVDGVSTHDYVRQGPAAELDVGGFAGCSRTPV